MSAGTQIVALRKGIVRITRYATHLPDCAGDSCTCGFVEARKEANQLSKADPGRTGRPNPRNNE